MSTSNIFGPNAWLIDEQFQQYSKDPSSVDKEWRDYFEANGAPKSKAPAKEAAKKPSKPAAKKTEGTTTARKQEARETNVDKSVAKAQEKSAKAKQSVKKSESPLDRIADYKGGEERQLKGMFKAIAKNMEESLEIPTATTVRDMPVKLMWENRSMINDHLKRTRGGKISFTHIIGYAMVKAVQLHPDMNVRYELKDGKPYVIQPEYINLGLAIDLPQKDGSRALVVAAIKECETKSFSEFVEAYEDIVTRSRKNKLTMDDFSGVTINLTNPGGIGTRHSIARLTKGAGSIIGVGSMDYPAEFAGASADRLADLGVGRLVTLTSTYDHRVIQGAESGEFLRTIGQLLVDGAFWDDLFSSMGVPYEPFRWAQDVPNSGVDKNTRVMQLIEAYRSRGHLLADTNPLGWIQPGLPNPDHRDLDIATHGLTIWDLDRTFNVGGFGGKEQMTLREVLSRLRAAYTLKVGSEYTHILDRDERGWLQDRLEAGMPKPTNAEQKYILQKVNAAEAFENFLQTKYVGQKRFSLEGAETLIPLLDSIIDTAAGQDLDEVVIGMPHRGRLNVLFNIVGKPLADIFGEFDGNYKGGQLGGSGDVSTTWAPRATTCRCLAMAKSRSPLPPTHPTSRPWIRSWRASPALSRTSWTRAQRATPLFRSCCMAMPPSPAWALFRRPSTCPSCAVTPTAAPSTSWSITRWALPPPRTPAALPTTPPTWPRASTARSSTSTAMTQRQLSGLVRWQPSTAASLARTSSSTSWSTACAVTMRPMTRP